MSNLSFHKVSSTRPASEYLLEQLSGHLSKGKRVLWLVPGGSAIKIATDVSKNLPKKNINNLVVTLTDERYGAVNHADSNWRQLKENGFDLIDAQLIPVLDTKDLSATTEIFATTLTSLFNNSDYRIGLLGIGADGHIAGIKPKSPPIAEKIAAAGYQWSDYTRITITPEAIRMLDETVVYLAGREKWPVIRQLAYKDVPLETQPAQILKQVKKATIYNDYLSL